MHKPISFFVILFIWMSVALAELDFGVGLSSFTSGRPIPALAVGVGFDTLGVNLRSTGVQTPVYAQNAWTGAIYSKLYSEQIGPGSSTGTVSIGGGLGVSYIIRSYRESLTANTSQISETLAGPYLAFKYVFGGVSIGADVVLGVQPESPVQALTLNFQDMAFVTLGFSL